MMNEEEIDVIAEMRRMLACSRIERDRLRNALDRLIRELGCEKDCDGCPSIRNCSWGKAREAIRMSRRCEPCKCVESNGWTAEMPPVGTLCVVSVNNGCFFTGRIEPRHGGDCQFRATVGGCDYVLWPEHIYFYLPIPDPPIGK